MKRGSSVVWLRRRSAPWAVLDVLRRRRRVQLRPAVYVGVALVGLLLGVLTPLSWWLPPLVLLVLAWVGPVVDGFPGGSLREDLLDAVHPAGALRRDDERTAALLRASTLPLYAVVDWSGLRILSGCSTSGDTATSFELVFFRAGVDDPSVRVSTATGHLEGVRRQVTFALAGAGRPLPADLEPEAVFAELDARHDALTRRPWEQVELVVDGHASAAELLRGDDSWAVLWPSDGVVVSVVGDRVPRGGVRLERVVNVEPYVSGLAELRRLHG